MDDFLWATINYPCPCCGYFMFAGEPGTNGICKICFWQDDEVCLRWPLMALGPNKVSLLEAQKNYVDIGASEPRLRHAVRPANQSDLRDSTWRPIDLNLDTFEKSPDFDAMNEEEYEDYLTKRGPVTPYPNDRTRLYYWRDNFWRKQG